MASKSAVVEQLLSEGTHTAQDIMRRAGCTISFVFQRARACKLKPALESKPLHPKHAEIEAAVLRAKHTYCQIASHLEVSPPTVRKYAAQLGVKLPIRDGKREAAAAAIKEGGKSLAQIGRELGISTAAMSRHASRVRNPRAAKLPKELPPNPDPEWLTDEEARSIFGRARNTLRGFRDEGMPALDGRKLKHKKTVRYMRGAYGGLSKRRLTVSSRQMLQENADALATPVPPDLQSVPSLARELDISETVVRNHIKKGTLRKRKVVTSGKGPARKTFIEHNNKGRVLDPRKPNRFKSIEPAIWTWQGVKRVCFPKAAKIIGISVGKVYEWHRDSVQIPAFWPEGEDLDVATHANGHPYLSLKQAQAVRKRRDEAKRNGWAGRGTLRDKSRRRFTDDDGTTWVMVKDSPTLANIPSSLVERCQGDKEGKNAKPDPWLEKPMRLKWQDGARFADLAELQRLGRRYQQTREAGWTGKGMPRPFIAEVMAAGGWKPDPPVPSLRRPNGLPSAPRMRGLKPKYDDEAAFFVEWKAGNPNGTISDFLDSRAFRQKFSRRKPVPTVDKFRAALLRRGIKPSSPIAVDSARK